MLNLWQHIICCCTCWGIKWTGVCWEGLWWASSNYCMFCMFQSVLGGPVFVSDNYCMFCVFQSVLGGSAMGFIWLLHVLCFRVCWEGMWWALSDYCMFYVFQSVLGRPVPRACGGLHLTTACFMCWEGLCPGPVVGFVWLLHVLCVSECVGRVCGGLCQWSHDSCLLNQGNSVSCTVSLLWGPPVFK